MRSFSCNRSIRPIVAMTRWATLPCLYWFSTICRYWRLPDFLMRAKIRASEIGHTNTKYLESENQAKNGSSVTLPFRHFSKVDPVLTRVSKASTLRNYKRKGKHYPFPAFVPVRIRKIFILCNISRSVGPCRSK